MTKVTISKDHIEIKGHAMYDVHGRDIVCASISCIVITSVNGILSIDESYLKYSNKSGYISIDILKHDKIVDSLIDNMINLLKELSDQYKKNIQIKEV